MGNIKRTRKNNKIDRSPDPRLKYCDSMPQRVYDLCALGLTNIQLATAFGVCLDTIGTWRRLHPDFNKALLAGKMLADAGVAVSMLKRAQGYDYKEDKVFNVGGKLEVVSLTKHQPSDTRAGMYWLNNRQKKLWKSETGLKVSGDPENPVQINHSANQADMLDLENLTPEQLGALEQIALNNQELLEAPEEERDVDVLEDWGDDTVCGTCGEPISDCTCED